MTDELFGTGFAVDSDFDIAEVNGSIQTINGRAVLERDIAFTLVREIGVERGTIPDADFAAEIELRTRRVLTRDPRITAIETITVDLEAPGKPNTAVIETSITAADGNTEALILTI